MGVGGGRGWFRLLRVGRSEGFLPGWLDCAHPARFNHSIMLSAIRSRASRSSMRLAFIGARAFSAASASNAESARAAFLKKPVSAVVCDMAGTLVDHGSIAPVLAFVEVFNRVGVKVSVVRSAISGAHARCRQTRIPDLRLNRLITAGFELDLSQLIANVLIIV